MGMIKKNKGSKASAVVKLIIMSCVCYYFHGKSMQRRAVREKEAARSAAAADEPESVIDINSDPEWEAHAGPSADPGSASAAAPPPKRSAEQKWNDMINDGRQAAAWLVPHRRWSR